MHRTTFVPQSLCWSVVFGLVIQAGFLASTATGQTEPVPQFVEKTEKKETTIPLHKITIGETKFLRMREKVPRDKNGEPNYPLIAHAHSENPNVVAITHDRTNPKVVLITGKGPGKTRIFLSDDIKEPFKEAVDIYIPSGRETHFADFMEKQKKRFNDLVRDTFPTANVQANLAGETVILTGTVPDPETVNVILDLARGVFRDPEGAEQLSGGPPVAFPGVPATAITQLTTMQRLVIVNGIRIGGVQQVQLEVVVARVSRNELRNMGFNWHMQHTATDYSIGNILGLESLTRGGTLASEATASAFQLATSNGNIPFAIDSGGYNLLSFFQALRGEGLVKLLAEPKLVTLSGKPAYFLSGGQQAVPTVSGFGGTAGVDFVPFGTEINFLPIVLGNGKIYLEVTPTVSRLDQTAGINSPTVGIVPGRNIQQARTALTIDDGETVAIGGLIQSAVQASTRKVPILGDLPFLGTAFRTVSYDEVEEELVILVTPRLIDPMSCDQLPKVLPGRETRSPDDFELFLEGILEAPRGCRKVCRGHRYAPAYRSGPTADKFPCCPHGQCGPRSGCEKGACADGLMPTSPWLNGRYDSMVPASEGARKTPGKGGNQSFPEKSLPKAPASSHNNQSWLPSAVSATPGLIRGDEGKNSGAPEVTYGMVEVDSTSASQGHTPATVGKPQPGDPPPLPQATLTFGSAMPKDAP